jgi:type II secretory pathway predicted ATPase ExeA
MYESYWGLTDSPFTSRLSTRWFHESPVHEEGIARLFYLIEQQRGFGVLNGEPGTGKSLLLKSLGEQVQRSGRHVANVNLNGLDQHEMLWQLATKLDLSPADSESRWSLWRRIEDEIRARQLTGIHSVLILDHLDQADSTCHTMVQRLVGSATEFGNRVTFIVALRTDGLGRLARMISALSDLQVELTYLQLDETDEFIRELLATAGAERDVFEGDAVIRIHTHSQGCPRMINRLCELSMIAAMAESSDIVTGEIVETVADGLVMPLSPAVESNTYQYA